MESETPTSETALIKPKPNKKNKKQRGSLSLTSFIVIMSIILLVFFSLFTLVTLIADGAKISLEAIEMITNLERSLKQSNNAAQEILDAYIAEKRKKLDFAEYYYQQNGTLDTGDQDIFGDDQPIGIFDENGKLITSTAEFPVNQRLMQKCIREFNSSGKDAVYENTAYNQQILFQRVNVNTYIAMLDSIYEKLYLSENLDDSQMIVESAEITNAFIIAEKDGSYYAGPDRFGFSPGDPMSDVFQNASFKLDDITGKLKLFIAEIGGKRYYILEEPLGADTDNITAYCVLDLGYVLRQSRNTIAATIIGILSMLILTLYYLHQYRKSQATDTPETKRAFRYKKHILMTLSVVTAVMVAYYSRTIFCVSSYVMDDRTEIETVKDAAESRRVTTENVLEQFAKNHTAGVGIISKYLSAVPEARTRESLKELSGLFGYEYLMIMDMSGYEVMSDADYLDMELSSDPEQMSYQFRKLLNGIPSAALQDYDDMTGIYHWVAGVPLKSPEGDQDGILIAGIRDSKTSELENASPIGMAIDEIMKTGQTDFYLVDPETGLIVDSPDDDLNYLPAADYGFTEKVLTPGFSGRVTMNDTTCYMTQGEYENLYIYAATPFSVVFGSRAWFTVTAAIITALIFVLTASLVQRIRILRLEVGPRMQNLVDTGEGIVKKAKPVAERWSLQQTHRERTPEEKTTALFLRMVQVLGLAIGFVLLFRKHLLPQNSLILRVLDGEWEHGLNVYAVTAVLILLLTAMIVVSIILYILRIMTRILSPRGETFCRLLRSAVEYISVIVVGFSCFNMLGAKMESLITTTSMMALLVGMGAQDLTADIIAGLFLMFESEFQVGDVIDVGGKTGIVREIGLHSTKLIDANNNVLAINNSKLSDIINRAQRNSMAFVNLTLLASVPIADLEELFQKELPPLKDKYPKLLGEPKFLGVNAFDANKMKCSIGAEVKEYDRIPMERALNQEVLRILKKAGIDPQ